MDLLTLSIAKKYTDESILGIDGVLKGEKGDPGHTSVRGEDYWTEDDKAIIMSEIAKSEDAPAIVCEETGSVIAVNDPSDRLLKGLTLYGKTTQDGTPTPEAPVELVSAGASGAINTTVGGKNLWSAECSPTFTRQKDFDCNLIAGTYTISAVIVSSDTDSEMCLVYDGTNGKTLGQLKRNTRSSLTFTLEKPTSMLVLYASSNGNLGTGDTATYTDIQVEMGATATAYEPYVGSTLTASTPNGLPGIPVSSGGNYTDENGQQWICDEIDFAKGVYVQRVKIDVLDGDENWSMSNKDFGSVTYFYAPYNDMIATNKERKGAVLSDRFVESYGSNTIEHIRVHGSAGELMLFITTSRLNEASVNGLKEWLAGHNTKIVYQLNNPIETPLSAEEMAQFSALRTNEPNTTVYNDGGAGMAIKYVADTKMYIDNKLAAISAAVLNA